MNILWISLIGLLLIITIMLVSLLITSKYVKFIRHTDLITIINKPDIGPNDYTTLYQSKTLVSLGLLEKYPNLNPSAYYVYYDWIYNTTPLYVHVDTPTLSFNKAGNDYVPAWSTDRLINWISNICNYFEIEYKNNYYKLRYKINKKLYITEKRSILSDLLFDVIYYILKNENESFEEIEEEN